jgi:hypothetical protein
MKYSFFCKNCGDSFMSDDRAEVEAYKRLHKIKMIVKGIVVSQSCPMLSVGKKLFERPKSKGELQ